MYIFAYPQSKWQATNLQLTPYCQEKYLMRSKRFILSSLGILFFFTTEAQIRLNEIIFDESDSTSIVVLELENISYDRLEISKIFFETNGVRNELKSAGQMVGPRELIYVVDLEVKAEKYVFSSTAYGVLNTDLLIHKDSVIFSVGYEAQVLQKYAQPLIEPSHHWSFLDYKGLRIPHIIDHVDAFLGIPNDDYLSITSSHYNPNLLSTIKVSEKTGFKPCDSSPNAMVILRDSIYRFSGWEWSGNDLETPRAISGLYASKASPSLSFNPILEQAPYDPYASFFTLNDSLYAVSSNNVWSSFNGRDWSYRNHDLNLIMDVIPTDAPGVLIVDKDGVYYTEDLIEFDLRINIPLPKDETVLTNHIYKDGTLFQYRGYVFEEELDTWFSPDSIRVYKDILGKPQVEEYRKDHFPEDLIWNPYVLFDDKVYSFFGWSTHYNYLSHNGNFNTIYQSEDGLNFEEFSRETDVKISPRHAAYALVQDDYVVLSSGYSGGWYDNLNEDIYFFFGETMDHYFSSDSLVLARGFGQFHYDFEDNLSSQLLSRAPSFVVRQSTDSVISSHLDSSNLVISDFGLGITHLLITSYHEGEEIFIKEIVVDVQQNPVLRNIPNRFVLQEGVGTLNIDLREYVADPKRDTYVYEASLGKEILELDQEGPLLHLQAGQFGSDTLLVDIQNDFGGLQFEIPIKVNSRPFRNMKSDTIKIYTDEYALLNLQNIYSDPEGDSITFDILSVSANLEDFHFDHTTVTYSNGLGQLQVEITDEFGGVLIDTLFLEALASGNSTSTQDLLVYPNPLNGTELLMIERLAPNQWISLVDLHGNVVISKRSTEIVEYLDLTRLKFGVYLLIVGEELGNARRIIKN